MSEARPLMAVFGGTFDPFHKAHEWLCHQVLDRPEIDQLRLLPCQTPALKDPAQASAEERLRMLEAWVATQSAGDRLVIDTSELDRPGPSYSADTLEALRQAYPDWRRVFVLGADAFASLPRWYGIERLVDLTHFWVFGRGDRPVCEPELDLTETTDLTCLKRAGSGLWFRGPASGSLLASRELRQNRTNWHRELPEAIYRIVERDGLYRDNP